jgi:hypothetical protein
VTGRNNGCLNRYEVEERFGPPSVFLHFSLRLDYTSNKKEKANNVSARLHDVTSQEVELNFYILFAFNSGGNFFKNEICASFLPRCLALTGMRAISHRRKRLSLHRRPTQRSMEASNRKSQAGTSRWQNFTLYDGHSWHNVDSDP